MCYIPLWNEDKYKLLDELFNRNFTCLFKVIDHTVLPESLLGKPLTRECIKLFEKKGIDICGEKGEYHTFTINGPIFKNKIKLDNYTIHSINNYNILV